MFYLSPFSSLSVSILEAPLNRQSYRNGRRSGECKTGVWGGYVCQCVPVYGLVWTSETSETSGLVWTSESVKLGWGGIRVPVCGLLMARGIYWV